MIDCVVILVIIYTININNDLWTNNILLCRAIIKQHEYR